MLITGGIANHVMHFATTNAEHAHSHGINNPAILPDCNWQRPVAALQCASVSLMLVLRLRPDVVITTGAAPGFFCLLWGRLFGARTLWIDSVANAEKLSLSGRLARRIAHCSLTQWEHLADGSTIHFAGSVL